MRYLIVAEAYRDLEQASGRLVLIERMAELVTQTPAELLPIVCYLCQGQIAPEFAGVDLGLAEKMAIRALAAAIGTEAAHVAAAVRRGRRPGAGRRAAAGRARTAAEPAADGQPGGGHRCSTLRQIAAAEGQGSQGRKLELLAGLLGRATPLEARYLLRLVTGNLRLGIGTPTILDALAQVLRGRASPTGTVLERAYNICCDIGQVAATLVSGGLAAVAELTVQAGNPVRAMLAQRLSDAAGHPGQAGRGVLGGVQVRRGAGAGAPHRGRADRAVDPAAGEHQRPSSPTWSRCCRTGWGRARRSARGKSWRTTRRRVSSGRSAK